MKPEAPFSHLSPLCDHHHLQAHGIPLNQPIALESPPTISEPSTLCAPTSANSACFPDHQPPPAQHRPVQLVSATSQSISPGRNTRFLSPYTGNSPFLLDHAASTSVACVVSNAPVPDRKGCPTAHRRQAALSLGYLLLSAFYRNQATKVACNKIKSKKEELKNEKRREHGNTGETEVKRGGTQQPARKDGQGPACEGDGGQEEQRAEAGVRHRNCRRLIPDKVLSNA